MDRRLSIVLCLLILGVWACIANASPVNEEVSHERVRRDINGLFDLIGGFFKKDENGQSQAGNLMQSLFGAMGGGKPAA